MHPPQKWYLGLLLWLPLLSYTTAPDSCLTKSPEVAVCSSHYYSTTPLGVGEASNSLTALIKWLSLNEVDWHCVALE